MPDQTATPPARPGRLTAVADGDRVLVLHDLRHTEVAWPSYDVAAADEETNTGSLRAPINGRVAKVFVEEGSSVDKGQRIAVIEAMKMEHLLLAPRAGIIARLSANEGQQVTEGTVLATLVEE
jgi:3-methylcrotonyl-CoA carboxylase alpha subunit